MICSPQNVSTNDYLLYSKIQISEREMIHAQYTKESKRSSKHCKHCGPIAIRLIVLTGTKLVKAG
jgi:hypothetical protein